MPDFSIIIPVFNKWELTRGCLASLGEHGSGPSFEVIVVDNGSEDETATELPFFGTALFGENFRFIRFSENRNFGPACNAGARAARAPVLFFLNNDTLVTPNWAEPLLKALYEEKDCGAVGPLLLYQDETVQHMGVAVGAAGVLHLYQGFPKDHPVVFRKRNLQAITAAALMMRADLFHACGEFYEGYKNGFEDLELCVRIARHGKKLRCVSESVVYHLESRTPNRKKYDQENGSLFASRCGSDIFVDLHYHALRDGFEVFITDVFSIGVRLGTDEEERLAAQAEAEGAQAETGSAQAWAKLVRMNPYWVRGREVLAQSLERAGRQCEAVPLRMELADIEPLIPRYRDLLRLAPFAEDVSWLPSVRHSLSRMERLASDRAAAAQAARMVTAKTAPKGNSLLESLYAEKIRRLFPR